MGHGDHARPDVSCWGVRASGLRQEVAVLCVKLSQVSSRFRSSPTWCAPKAPEPQIDISNNSLDRNLSGSKLGERSAKGVPR
jgi:hypothetical protein